MSGAGGLGGKQLWPWVNGPMGILADVLGQREAEQGQIGWQHRNWGSTAPRVRVFALRAAQPTEATPNIVTRTLL